MSMCVYVEFIFFPSFSLEFETVTAVGFQSWLNDFVFVESVLRTCGHVCYPHYSQRQTLFWLIEPKIR